MDKWFLVIMICTIFGFVVAMFGFRIIGFSIWMSGIIALMINMYLDEKREARE